MGMVREVEILVFEKFPRTDAERRCKIERAMMDVLRNRYRQQLYNEFTRKANILATVHPATTDN
jgi:hypothetical protein